MPRIVLFTWLALLAAILASPLVAELVPIELMTSAMVVIFGFILVAAGLVSAQRLTSATPRPLVRGLVAAALVYAIGFVIGSAVRRFLPLTGAGVLLWTLLYTLALSTAVPAAVRFVALLQEQRVA